MKARTPIWQEAFDFASRGSRGAHRALPRGTQICGVQYSISVPFLIETRKRLKIAATQRKHSSPLTSNRHNFVGCFEPRSRTRRILANPSGGFSAGPVSYRPPGNAIQKSKQASAPPHSWQAHPFSIFPFPFSILLYTPAAP